MSFKSLAKRNAALGAVAALSLFGAGVALAPVASAASVPGTLSSTTGPSAGGNVLTLTTTTAKFVSGMTAQFQFVASATTACTAAPGTPAGPPTPIVNAVTTKVLSTTRYALTVPAGVVLVGSVGTYNLCVYNGTSLEVTAKYTVASAPTVSAISPAAGPAMGGNTVTITGTNFPTGVLTTATTPVVKLGSVAATNVKVVNATTITATAPSQAASATPFNVSVTTTGGTVTLAGAYTYKNGIVASPNFVSTSAAAPVDISVQGVGFSTLDFTTTTGATPDNNRAHVNLATAAYDQTDKKTECTDVLVLSDTELICSIDVSKSIAATVYGPGALAAGHYTMYVVNDGSVVSPTFLTVPSSGSTFTVAEF
jgi:hypothetical protein